jgi:hypothetical protein
VQENNDASKGSAEGYCSQPLIPLLNQLQSVAVKDTDKLVDEKFEQL